MRIVFPDGAGCVQAPSDLDPLRALGPVDFYDGPPPDRATLLERLRPAEAVVLDYSEMDAEVLRACERLRFISFHGIGYARASRWPRPRVGKSPWPTRRTTAPPPWPSTRWP
jgi:hypothetical protein